jgi:hypothetical protein
LDLLTAEMDMYIHHSPMELTTGKAIPNIVHSVLQQAVCQRLADWIVSALLYRTTHVITIPVPGYVSAKMIDGSIQINMLKL